MENNLDFCQLEVYLQVLSALIPFRDMKQKSTEIFIIERNHSKSMAIKYRGGGVPPNEGFFKVTFERNEEFSGGAG